MRKSQKRCTKATVFLLISGVNFDDFGWSEGLILLISGGFEHDFIVFLGFGGQVGSNSLPSVIVVRF